MIVPCRARKQKPRNGGPVRGFGYCQVFVTCNYAVGPHLRVVAKKKKPNRQFMHISRSSTIDALTVNTGRVSRQAAAMIKP